MTTSKIVVVCVLLAAIAGGIGVYFLVRHSGGQHPSTDTQTGTLPSSGSVSSTTLSTDTVPETKMVVTSRGTNMPVIVNAFLKNGTTVPDVQNPGRYFLAGSVGYCLADGTCPAGAVVDGANVVYDSSQQIFMVALTKEPLADSRSHAEQFLLSTLGITQPELCSLNYYVGTTVGVNEFYAGKNLGFSFCPGAVQLPQ